MALAAVPVVLLPNAAVGQDVDLGNLGDRGFRIDGIDASDSSGISVSGAGDVNGDGLADLIVGARYADPGGDSNAGEAYVIFGRPGGGVVGLATLGSGGFRIDGVDSEDEAGLSVSGAGDVNGDGLADLIVGAHGGDPSGDSAAGEVYVVFGKSDGATIDLAGLGARGFRIEGIDPNDRAGGSVSGAGDVNGDGLADLVVGARLAASGGDIGVGEAYVVFGRSSSSTVDLANLGAGGFRIDGRSAFDAAGTGVAGAGDVNGDGLGDLIIGAPGSGPGEILTGTAFVVFGKTDSAPVSLASLGAAGFRVDGIEPRDATGFSVSGAGDVNGDGLADVILGAPGPNPGGILDEGASFVVFGKADSSAVSLATLGAGGFRINGVEVGDLTGRSVSGAGDVNGDGLADLIVGAPRRSRLAFAAGESYVVFGKSGNSTVDLANLGADGFRMAGVDGFDGVGASVSGAGDVNGDGLADVIIGAPGMAPSGNPSAGSSYVVFGSASAPSSATVRARAANGDAPLVAFGVSGDGSNDSSPDARAWIDFEDGADPKAAASVQTVTLLRSAGAFASAGARVAWRLQTTRQSWGAAEVRLRYLDSELLVPEASLQIVFSPTGLPPYTPLPSVVESGTNTVTAAFSQPGYFYLAERPIYSDGFEGSP